MEASQPLPDQSQQRSEVAAAVGFTFFTVLAPFQESGRVKDKVLIAESCVSLLIKTAGASSRRMDNEEFGEWPSGLRILLVFVGVFKSLKAY